MANNLNWMGNKVIDGSNTGSQSSSVRQSVQPKPAQQQSEMQKSQSVQTAQKPPVPPAPPAPSAAPVSEPLPAITYSGDPYSPAPSPVMDIAYVQGYLKQNLGKNVRAEFVLSGNLYMDKAGRLIEVGISYFVLEDFVSRAHIMCDMYSLKFVTTL